MASPFNVERSDRTRLAAVCAGMHVSMNVSVCLCGRACVYTCVSVCVRERMRFCTCVNVCQCTCTYLCEREHLCVRLREVYNIMSISPNVWHACACVWVILSVCRHVSQEESTCGFLTCQCAAMFDRCLWLRQRPRQCVCYCFLNVNKQVNISRFYTRVCVCTRTREPL